MNGSDEPQRQERSAWPVRLLTAIPLLAAIGGLVFTGLQVSQAQNSLEDTQDAQIATRFNEAVKNLAGKGTASQAGGIYALERLMEDSEQDQPRVIAVLSAYIREQAPRKGAYPEMTMDELAAPVKPEVRAAVDVLASRHAGKDGRARIDWTFTDLRGLELKTRRFSITVDRDENAPNLEFIGADLTEADLRHSILVGLNMNGAFLRHTNLSYATVGDIGLIDAYLSGAVMEGMTALRGTVLYCARMADAVANDAKFVGIDLAATDLTAANLKNADLRWASLAGSNLTDAKLNNANLEGAHLGSAPTWSFGYGQPPAALLGADLTGANLRNADLTGVHFGPSKKGERGANLTDADLTGANLTGADLTGAILTGAHVTDRQLASTKRDEKIVEYPDTCQREKYYIPQPSFDK